jgi:phosphoribosylaminoimidazole-succinocarboxamide synthase
MNKCALKYSFIPELGVPRRGKVRDIYSHDKTITMVTSDRISVFDNILPDPIPQKGKILTDLLLYWFEHTKDIIPNHILSKPDSNVIIVKKCKPIMVEVIVRGYLVGSLWRDYSAGKRVKCGIALPEGLKQNDRLPNPIITPTTKCEHGHDEDITEDEIINQGLATKEVWNKIKDAAFKLYKRGQDLLMQRGLILVDTKYEFGMTPEGDVILIDEIHTPDSSRFLYQKDYDLKEIKFPDKEFLREWLKNQGYTGNGIIPPIPDEIREKVLEGYKQVYHTITGLKLDEDTQSPSKRIVHNLKDKNHIKGVFALIVAGSESDRPHIDKINNCLKEHQIPTTVVIASAHKQPRAVLELIELYNQSQEPLVCITVAGRSNALSGMMACNLKWPVIACPPFKDYSDYLTNIHSSLQMPSKTPAMTVIDPGNAALAAVNILKTMELI